MSTFHANIAIMPTVAGEALPADLRKSVAGKGTITTDQADYLELDMTTKDYPNWKWMEALSARFPSLRIAIRGENPTEGYVSFGFASGGRVLRKRSEHGKSMAYLNMKAMLFPDWGFTQDTDDEGIRVSEIVASPFANATLLWQMENFADLTAAQEYALFDNPNYLIGFEPDTEWWLGQFRSC